MNDFSIRKHITSFLQKWIKANKVSDNAFANTIGVSAASVRRWRLGLCIPDIDLFPQICDYMNVSILDFIGFDEKNSLPKKQKQILDTYKNSESFRIFIDAYLDNAEIQSAIDTFIKFLK